MVEEIIESEDMIMLPEDFFESEGFAVSSPLLTRQEVREIQSHIANIVRPTWHCGVPLNIGDGTHGKLKADQWRSSIEFDLSISIAQLWSGALDGGLGTNGRRHELFCSTMYLAIAIRWATSHRTSPHHATKYMEYMKKYLESLLCMFPEISLKPNHHNALHIGEFLLNYGPMHGWWMFPFERVINVLQQVNTNDKLGP